VDYEQIRQEVKDLFVREDPKFSGWSFRPIFKSIDEATRSSRITKDAVISFINQRENSRADYARPKRGAWELASYLDAKGIWRGVFSRMNRRGTERCLKAAGLQGFAIVLGREDAASFKPDPDQIALALKTLGVRAGETVVVGDHPYDMMAGKRAGTFCVGVLSGTPKAGDLRDAGADLVLKDLMELLGRFRHGQDH
jgi:beta-phosphoglucomutase-like phosphatase (HAD superfamily)